MKKFSLFRYIEVKCNKSSIPNKHECYISWEILNKYIKHTNFLLQNFCLEMRIGKIKFVCILKEILQQIINFGVFYNTQQLLIYYKSLLYIKTVLRSFKVQLSLLKYSVALRPARVQHYMYTLKSTALFKITFNNLKPNIISSNLKM